jgi:hypothetical protein
MSLVIAVEGVVITPVPLFFSNMIRTLSLFSQNLSLFESEQLLVDWLVISSVHVNPDASERQPGVL